MPCLQPFRDDSAQLLLFKIASCLEAGGGGSGGGVTSFNGLTGAVTGVISFNGRDGVVILTLADVAAVADGRYVLKAGDTMTGALVHPDGTAALPSITFTGDLDTGIYHPAADMVNITVGGVSSIHVEGTGVAIGAASSSGYRLLVAGDIRMANNLFFDNPMTFVSGAGDGYGIQSSVVSGLSFFSNSAAARLIIQTTGDILIPTAGRLSIQSGANQRAGDVVLVAGTVTTANTTVTANTRVYTSRKTAGGVLGNLTYTLIAATSFTITSDNAGDTSTVSYLLIEVP